MNHSWGKIEAIKELLNSSDSPPIYDSLFLNAESAYNKKVYKMAVLESFQAFEIFLENYLIDKFVKNGLTHEKAIEKITEGNNWRTPDRLKLVLHEAIGHKLTEDISLWQEWHDGYNEVRNEVIHRNKNISEKKTRKMLDANIKVFNWLNNL
jgi:hypothetical protein